MSTANIIKQIKSVVQRIERNTAKKDTASEKILKAKSELRKLYKTIPKSDLVLYEETLSKYRDHLN